ncbi:uncharacterized protein LACBIDRAFT_327404 [Laccaria bicolor S238N-H82]|uniref:Predicted protein n=1 Tax=Laccaria bicolor (strain S238N-H82 / ATCC MYA-4686) TaxID=486041 RepID=B0DAY7_LACBS|nr:uncharacterized protein LACBIDRAFT_327404 [Laccaria bicolor S238N-H82]EDR08114.1 predicted protein [Laccaria bicolor S238N-H82]|eukprot:XP_001881184.1 predicted protein [Laccaria bicolor S238N-H82]
MVFFQSRDRTSKHYSSESYEESLPDCPYPWIFGVGHVPSKSETLTNTNTKIFPVSHTEYVRESSRNSYVICAYDGDAPRWTNTPAPLPQACVQYFGICHSVLPNGHLRVNVESIILSLVPLSSPDQSTISTPTRKRKFQAIASPSTASKITINSIPPVSASSSYVLSWSFINTSIHMTFEHVGSINQCVLGDSVPLGNPASSSALTMPNYGASSSMSVRLQSVPPVDINMHPDSGAAPSPLSTIDDFEADESLPPVASQSSKAKGKKKAKF